MAQTWLSIRVDLIEGHGEEYWPRPGRIFAAARSHTFKQLADAIDDAFRPLGPLASAGLHPRRRQALVRPGPGLGDRGRGHRKLPASDVVAATAGRAVRLRVRSRRRLGSPVHRRRAADRPSRGPGIVPDTPLPYWGWGDIPDQHRRRWDDDDGESPPPVNPGLTDLPPLRLSGSGKNASSGFWRKRSGPCSRRINSASRCPRPNASRSWASVNTAHDHRLVGGTGGHRQRTRP